MLTKFSFGNIMCFWKKVITCNISQYMLSQYSAYHKMFKITIISNCDLSIVIISCRGASGDPHPLYLTPLCSRINHWHKQYCLLVSTTQKLRSWSRRLVSYYKAPCELCEKCFINCSKVHLVKGTLLPNGRCSSVCSHDSWAVWMGTWQVAGNIRRKYPPLHKKWPLQKCNIL